MTPSRILQGSGPFLTWHTGGRDLTSLLSIMPITSNQMPLIARLKMSHHQDGVNAHTSVLTPHTASGYSSTSTAHTFYSKQANKGGTKFMDTYA